MPLSLQKAIQKQQPWMNKNLDPKDRARALMNQMTAEEKKGMLYGYGCQSKEWPYVGNVAAIPRLNIPSLKYNDGPQGFRDDAIPGSTTTYALGANRCSFLASGNASSLG